MNTEEDNMIEILFDGAASNGSVVLAVLSFFIERNTLSVTVREKIAFLTVSEIDYQGFSILDPHAIL